MLLKAGFCAGIALALLSCVAGRTEPFHPHAFPVPEVPSMISSRDDAMEYVVSRFWDSFTDTAVLYPCDTALVNGVPKDEVEQSFVDWVRLLHEVELSEAQRLVSSLFDKAAALEKKDTASNVLETVASLAESYLYDPNSPLRNEDLYLPFVRKMSEYEGFPASERAAYSYDADMCALNQAGTAAADFVFSDRYGITRSLYDIKAEYTLLFFSNPGCTACKSIIDRLRSDAVLSGLIASGRVAVANIYIDENLEGWYSYMSVYPEEWYNGYDPNFVIRTDVLYNVRAIPSLYLLDRDKRVLLKDAPEDRVFTFLSGL